ncbi:PQ-loop domain-containing transporter [Mycoplasma nasistruthionis]|uniref:PQ-loop repeat-containing protein n=1 Tax=Mycoplasma nasistruthionis TaxID=353852 RepID=A0A5B7XVP3_9MOLU|nr:PQ-loop domain-containing transporter [Mycoplasma nasistruthionis]QCZ36862.1 hypothetical protein FG904_02500 [Mycoplasma nasistruthionis]
MLNITYNIFLWLSAVFVISLSVPQLVKLLKDKKTGPVSFTSFWIFHIGILLWVVYGATAKQNDLFLNVIVADGIGLFVNGIMTGLLYYYKREFTSEQKLYGYLGILATWAIGTIFIGLYFAEYNLGHGAAVSGAFKFKVPEEATLIFGFVFPAFTTLAFLPQLIQSFKTGQWQGVSYIMYLLYVINNIVWIIWWGLGFAIAANNNDSYLGLIGGITWQIISLILFSIQLTFTLIDKRRRELAVQL